jgi:hypothetical protein
LSKLTAQQREQVRESIKFCRIRGLSLQATLEIVNHELPEGCSLTMPGLRNYIAVIKRESKNWMDTMALNLYNFVHELKQRWDSLHELSRTQWEALDNAKKQGDIDGQIKAATILCKINDQILQMLLLLPTVRTPSSLPYPLEPEPLGPSLLNPSQPHPTEVKEPIL